ncbi:unnamed protein product, partial [Phaeothamnion confervicola]
KGKSDLKVLKQLEHELQYRQVPRAVALLAEVQAAMYGSTSAAPPAAVPTPPRAPAPVSQQPDLWGRSATQPVVSAPTSVRTVAPAVKPPESPPATKPASSTPAVPLGDAYKILKASLGATWESLEQTRRTLVQQSHPSRWKTLSTEKCAQALAEAKRVNAAYAALSQARCGGR